MRKSLVKLQSQNTFEKFKSDRNLRRISLKVMYNVSRLCQGTNKNGEWGGGGGAS